MTKNTTFSGNLSISGRPDVDFRPFWVPKQVPAVYFFGVFSKTVILSKSCSRCGGSTVFKGQTLQKSIPRPTPNDNNARKRKKSLPAVSGGTFSAPGWFLVDFWVPAGSQKSPKLQFSRLRLAPGAHFFADLVQNTC